MRRAGFLLFVGCTTPAVIETREAEPAPIVIVDADAPEDASTPPPPPALLPCGTGRWRVHGIGPMFAADGGCDRATEVCCRHFRSNMCKGDDMLECTPKDACKGASASYACWRKSDCDAGEVCCGNLGTIECAASCKPDRVVETAVRE